MYEREESKIITSKTRTLHRMSGMKSILSDISVEANLISRHDNCAVLWPRGFRRGRNTRNYWTPRNVPLIPNLHGIAIQVEGPRSGLETRDEDA